MKRSNKHQVKIMQFRDFTGGVNITVSGDRIADNELQVGENIEFDYITGETRTRSGIGMPIKTFSSDLRKGWYNERQKVYYIVAGNHLYQTNITDVTRDLGVLSGTKIPCFCEFAGKIFVASGGKLQYIENTEMVTLNHAPNCDIVFERFGRLVIAKSGDDYLYYSAVGDAISNNAWVSNTSNMSSSQSLEIGYKDSGNIVAIEVMLQDLIVYKTNKIYRVLSEFPDWQVLELSRTAQIANKECTAHVGGNVVFLDRNSGPQELVAVQEYGDIHPKEMMYKVSPLIKKTLAAREARVWHLKNKRQIIIKCQNNEYVVVYHYLTGGATFWRFDKPIVDILEVDDQIVVLQGQSIYYMSRDNDKDNSTCVKAKLKTKKYTDYQDYLIKRITANLNDKTNGDFSISVNNLDFNFRFNKYRVPIYINRKQIYEDKDYIKLKYGGSEFVLIDGDTDKVYGNSKKVVVVTDFKVRKHQTYRNNYIEFEIVVNKGNLSWGDMQVEFAAVGV